VYNTETNKSPPVIRLANKDVKRAAFNNKKYGKFEGNKYSNNSYETKSNYKPFKR